MEKLMAKESTLGLTGKSTMENGSLVSNKVMECGKE